MAHNLGIMNTKLPSRHSREHDIGMADTGRDHLDQDLVVAGVFFHGYIFEFPAEGSELGFSGDDSFCEGHWIEDGDEGVVGKNERETPPESVLLGART